MTDKEEIKKMLRLKYPEIKDEELDKYVENVVLISMKPVKTIMDNELLSSLRVI